MATKKTAIKKTTAKKAAAKKQPVKKSASRPPAKAAQRKGKPAEALLTTVVAKVDIGWGNHLYIRGEGSGLSWDTGTLMDWSEDGWLWTTTQATKPIQFKVLINDEIWAEGDNGTVASGGTCIISPSF